MAPAKEQQQASVRIYDVTQQDEVSLNLQPTAPPAAKQGQQSSAMGLLQCK